VSGRGDPGVPDAIGRAGRLLGERVAMDRLDRLWVFPPSRLGRVERGLLVASLLLPDDLERRLLVTLRYTAEETGKGVSFVPLLQEEGVAPPDRLPRIIAGVVRRSGMEGGDPTEVSVGGSGDVYSQWLARMEQAAREDRAP
jgi:hypothetical protein